MKELSPQTDYIIERRSYQRTKDPNEAQTFDSLQKLLKAVQSWAYHNGLRIGKGEDVSPYYSAPWTPVKLNMKATGHMEVE